MKDKLTVLEVALPILQGLLASGHYTTADGDIKHHLVIDDALETADILIRTVEAEEAALAEE